jgi:hypothetical protein
MSCRDRLEKEMKLRKERKKEGQRDLLHLIEE